MLYSIKNHLRNLYSFKLPSFVRSNDCFPAPRREIAPATHGGTSFSKTGPIRAHICSKCCGLMCEYFRS